MKPRTFVIAVGAAALALAGLAIGWPRLSPPAPQGSRAHSTPSPTPAPAWFADRADAAGVSFRLDRHGKTPLPVLELMGTGCAACDLNGDGHADLFVVGETGVSPEGKSGLFRNNGDGTFTDVTQGSGLEAPGRYMGCAVADIDNDGQPDILVTGYGVNRLYRNLGSFHFADVTKGSGLESRSPTDWYSSAAFVDVDRDGLVDVYIGRYVIFNDHTIQLCDYGTLKAACGPLFYDPQRGSLYRNLGNFRFKDVTHAYGLDAAHGKCLGVAIGDINGDGWPDIYLANDEMPGDLFLNEGGKRFREVGAEAGVALAADGSMQGGMGVDFGDYNRDGLLDIFVTTFQGEPNALYANSRDGVFLHRGPTTGLIEPTLMMVGFGTKFMDVNNDGWLDLVITNGHIRDNQDLIDKMTHYRQPMQLFMNEAGQAFVNRSQEAGLGFTTPGVGRGLAVADLNNDGRLDIVTTDTDGPVRILINQVPNAGNWLRVQLRGTRSNRMGLGAQVKVAAGKEQWVAVCSTAGSYLSASDPRVHFGLGALKKVDRVEVLWPSGKRSVVPNPRIPGDLVVREP